MELRPQTEAGHRFVDIAEAHIEAFRARAGEHDVAGTFPLENVEDLKKSGASGAFVPQELGGLGLDSVVDWAAGMERFGRADASTAIALNMHLTVSRMQAQLWRGMRADGDAEGAARSEGLLRAIASGGVLACAAVTEAGTDFLRPHTTATRADGGWVLDGHKLFATLSPAANLLVLNARVPGEDGAADALAFAFLPIDTPGVEPGDDWDALGMRASGSQSVALRGVAVPEGSVQPVGEWGRWNAGVLMGRTLGNITLVAVFLGIAERAREIAVAAARSQQKTKLGGELGASPGVQHLVGEIDIDLATARAVLADAARELDGVLAEHAGGTPDLETAHHCMRDYQCAKWVVNRLAIRIVSRAMDVCGGGAYMAGHELSRLYRDVRAGPFMQPYSPTEAREYVGRVALGRYPEG